MKKKLSLHVFLIFLLAVFICGTAHAQANTVFDLEGTAGGHEKLSSLTSSTGFSSTYTNHSTQGIPFAALISVETSAIRITIDGTAPVVTGSSQKGHLLNAGDSYVIRGSANVVNFRCINASAGNGAVVMVTYFY